MIYYNNITLILYIFRLIVTIEQAVDNMGKQKVGLVYSKDFEKYNFSPRHPLQPLRVLLTYSLMEKINLLNHENLELIEPRYCTEDEINRVHSTSYMNTVNTLSNDPKAKNVHPFSCGLGPGDNPIFKGMYEASSLVCGATVKAAETLWKNDEFKAVFNPSGGLHHALKDRAAGFCIFNDVAVAIHHLKQQKKDIKIAYLDIDCHHGDGVQWLFYDDPNVLTISFHESGQFLFPGTGDIDELGEKVGLGFSLNFPLLPGTSNKYYQKIFTECVPDILEVYTPDVLVTQLGVDTYYRDPLTHLGVSIELYKTLAKEMDSYAQKYCNEKWLAVGGGGYLMTVVPRAWTIFLAQMLGVELSNMLPESWVQEVEQKVPDEMTPYSLWDNDDKMKVQLLKQPKMADKLQQHINSLIEVCHTKYLPHMKANLGKIKKD